MSCAFTPLSAVTEVDDVMCISVPPSRDVKSEFVYRLIMVRYFWV